MVNPTIFKAYDIRGLYPDEIDEKNIRQITKAIIFFFRKKLGKEDMTVVLGRDMRISSPSLFEQAKQVLLSMGVHIIDVGLVSTPTFYFAVQSKGYDAGIQITASHNPKDYNGIKFVLRGDQGLIKIGKSTGMDEIKTFATENDIKDESKSGKVTEKQGVVTDEVEYALSLLHNPHIAPFNIVADPANAMGASYIEALFKKIPGNLIKMNFDLDGTFPSHQPDPLNFENLKDLQKKVVEENADVGLAPDGDGDRLFFVDEKGQIVPASVITALVAREFLKDNPGSTILFDIRYILTPKQIIESLGGKTAVTKVGHAFITETMGQYDSPFAGESSAHYFYKATGNAESQVITILTVLKVMTETKKPLSQIVQDLKKSFESGEINFKVSNAQEIIDLLKDKYKDGDLSLLDGVAISYPSWRFSIRTSNTEPLLRLNLEALDEQTMNEKKNEVFELINAKANLL